MCKRIHTTNSSCSPRGAVTLYDTSGCSFTASALKEGISYIIVKFKLFCIFSIFISQSTMHGVIMFCGLISNLH